MNHPEFGHKHDSWLVLIIVGLVLIMLLLVSDDRWVLLVVVANLWSTCGLQLLQSQGPKDSHWFRN